MAQQRIDYYASLNSPWTHLGAARIEALAAKHGAELRIWPVDFGAIFAGSGGLPLPKRSPQRKAYRMQEKAKGVGFDSFRRQRFDAVFAH